MYLTYWVCYLQLAWQSHAFWAISLEESSQEKSGLWIQGTHGSKVSYVNSYAPQKDDGFCSNAFSFKLGWNYWLYVSHLSFVCRSGTNTWIKIPETRTTSIGLFTFHKFLQFISMLLFPFEISVDTMNQNIFSLWKVWWSSKCCMIAFSNWWYCSICYLDSYCCVLEFYFILRWQKRRTIHVHRFSVFSTRGRGKVCVHIVLFRLHLWNYSGYVVIWYSKQLLWFTKYFRKTLSVWICILPSVVLLIASQILVDVWTCDLKSISWFQIPNSSKSRIFGFPIWKSLCKPWLISLYLVK